MSEIQSTTSYRDVPNFPGYRVGDDGSVWTCRRKAGTWKRMKPYTRGKTRHLRVNLTIGHRKYVVKLVHRLVLIAFVGPCPEGMECCHYPDSNPGNNALSNLRWDTKSANSSDSLRHGTRPHSERHGRAKLTNENVRSIRLRLSNGETQKSIADTFGVTQSAIASIRAGKCWKHLPFADSTLPST